MASIFIQGFSNECNDLVYNSIKLAIENRTQYNTMHLGVMILLNDDVREMFKVDTDSDVDSIINGLLNKLGISRDIANKVMEDDDSEYVDSVQDVLENISKDVKYVIDTLVKKFNISKKEIVIKDCYKALISIKDTKFYNSLIELGISKSRLNSINDMLIDKPTLSTYGIDLNSKISELFDCNIYGRDEIIDNVIEVLGRKNNNNPCLIGESGVGKTTIVFGLVNRIIKNKVPYYLKGIHIIKININKLIAGAGIRGELEERLENLLLEANRENKIILFFDDIDNLFNINKYGEGLGVINILKPYLSDGTVQIIATSDINKYNNYKNTNSGFTRLLEDIVVEEPNVNDAIKMVAKTVNIYCKYHNILINDSVVEKAVKLSKRYITDRKLPDKAISLIDMTGARLKARKGLGCSIQEKDIRESISKLTGIDAHELDEYSKNTLLTLESRIKRRIVGQDHAIRDVVKAIKRNKVGLINEDKPIGTFMFIGQTGVGKTELCKVLAKEYFGSEDSIIRFDMSEYMEKHTISKLIGSPPGYVGYGDGGLLTDKVMAKPYSLVLFDEIEKAHSDVYNILLQVLDEGWLTDSRGNKVDFRNTIVIMTSNAGYDIEAYKNKIGFGNKGNIDKDIIKNLERVFRPEFLNRLDKIIVFNSLTKADIKGIVNIILRDIKVNLYNRDINVEFNDSLKDLIVDRGYSERYGARNVKRVIQDLVVDYLTDKIIDGSIKEGDSIELYVMGDEVMYRCLNKGNKVKSAIYKISQLPTAYRGGGL